MPTDEPEGDDLILERLRESASGDAAVRQLRRRYDSLRADYEQLLDRLGELEERVDPARGAPPPRQTASGVPTSALQLNELILAPLMRLRDDYMVANRSITNVVAGLESLAAGAFKGQHEAPRAVPEPGPATPKEPEQALDEPGTPQARPRRVQVDVRGRGFGELLDFQERLSALEGVARVSINAIDTERATLVVELDGEPPAGEP